MLKSRTHPLPPTIDLALVFILGLIKILIFTNSRKVSFVPLGLPLKLETIWNWVFVTQQPIERQNEIYL